MSNPGPIDSYRRIDPGDDISSSRIRRLWGVGNGEPLPRKKLMAQRSKAVMYTGAEIVGGVDERFVPAMHGMSHVMALHNYRPIHPGNWGIAYRRVRGGKAWSLHAFGCAVDIGAPANPMSRSFITDMPPAMILDLMRIRSVSTGERVWTWGGFWGVRGKRSDTMHFQANCGPKSLERGVVCGDGTMFNPGGAGSKLSSKSALGITPRVLSLGTKHAEVRDIQQMLIDRGFLPRKADDSSFGPDTQKAVIAWQRELGIHADGIWGPTTEQATRKRLAKSKNAVKQKKASSSKTADDAEAAVTRAYRRGLGRDPESVGKAYWTDLLTAGAYSELELVAFFQASEEGRARARSLAERRVVESEQYLAALYEERVGLTPSKEQLAVWSAELARFGSGLDMTVR